MEQEGANWTSDMAEQFKKRRGYDLMPYLPFTMFKTGGMGNTIDYNYGAAFTPEFNDIIQRVRYDFDLTKSELLAERFIKPFVEWCRQNKVKSRAQAYGRGFFPLEGSFDFDIPECETWIKYGIGGEVNETNYRIGRANTMINKWVSSAAHLKGKRLISCEELTNTDMVFNDTLEIQKVAGDQSTISGVTHPVFHGFNYSPPGAPFPGWIRYGAYFNEKNTWWPYFKKFTDYKAQVQCIVPAGGYVCGHCRTASCIRYVEPLCSAERTIPADHLSRLPAECLGVHASLRQCLRLCVRWGDPRFADQKWKTCLRATLLPYPRADTGGANGSRRPLRNSWNLCRPVDASSVSRPSPTNHLDCITGRQGNNRCRSHVAQMKAFTDRFIEIKKPEKNFTAWYKGHTNAVQYHSLCKSGTTQPVS